MLKSILQNKALEISKSSAEIVIVSNVGQTCTIWYVAFDSRDELTRQILDNHGLNTNIDQDEFIDSEQDVADIELQNLYIEFNFHLFVIYTEIIQLPVEHEYKLV